MHIKKKYILLSLVIIFLCSVIGSGILFASTGVFNKNKEITVIIDAGHER